MKVIGITGGVGSGKSQILSYIGDNYNCLIIGADEIGNEIKEPGEDCYKELIELLGTGILNKDKTINRNLMAEVIFKDETLLSKVNDIIHPKVVERIKEKTEAAREACRVDYTFIEAALLIECGFLDYVDEMWFIYARPEVRFERLKSSRGYSVEKIKNIMSSQLDDESFRKNSSVVIDNSNSLEDTYRQIKEALSENKLKDR